MENQTIMKARKIKLYPGKLTDNENKLLDDICLLSQDLSIKPNKTKQKKLDKMNKNFSELINLKQEQKVILKQWLGAARFYYNETIKFVEKSRNEGIKVSYSLISMRKEIMNIKPKWVENIPYEVIDQAISDACKACKNATLLYKTNGKSSKIKLRKKNNKCESFGIPARAIHDNGIYTTYLGEMKYSEKFNETSISRIQITKDGKYYLILPEERNINNNIQERYDIVALDPGVRTFQTYYSPEECGEIGKQDITKIDRLLHRTDKLQSEISQLNGKKKKSKAIARQRIFNKITNLVNELHHKTANFLTKKYKQVLIPEFATQQMAKQFKLNKDSKRRLMILSHFKFRQILEHHARKNQTSINVVSEEWTSKTCGCCGEINLQLGSKKLFICPKCGMTIDRDINGARNIFIKNVRLVSNNQPLPDTA